MAIVEAEAVKDFLTCFPEGGVGAYFLEKEKEKHFRNIKR